MAVRELAETVILQSIEDLWDNKQREACSSFFCGLGFSFWADAANMNTSERKKILSLILNSMAQGKITTQEMYGSPKNYPEAELSG